MKMRWQTIASSVSMRTISPTTTPLPTAYDCVAVYIAGRRTPGEGTPSMLGDMDVPPFWPPFLTFRGLNSIFLGYFLSSTNTKTIFCGIKTTNSHRIRSFSPQILFFPRSFWVQFPAASGTPPSVFGPSTPPPFIFNFIRNSNISIQENAFQSVVCEKAAILSRPQCVEIMMGQVAIRCKIPSTMPTFKWCWRWNNIDESNWWKRPAFILYCVILCYVTLCYVIYLCYLFMLFIYVIYLFIYLWTNTVPLELPRSD